MMYDEIIIRRTPDNFTRLSVRDSEDPSQGEEPLFTVPSANYVKPFQQLDRNEEWPPEEWTRICMLLQSAVMTAQLASALAHEAEPRPEYN